MAEIQRGPAVLQTLNLLAMMAHSHDNLLKDKVTGFLSSLVSPMVESMDLDTSRRLTSGRQQPATGFVFRMSL